MMTRLATIHASMDAMIQAIKDRRQHEQKWARQVDLATYLREHAVAGFHLPRQCGSMNWLASKVMVEPDSLLITAQLDRNEATMKQGANDRPLVWMGNAEVEMTQEQTERIRTRLEITLDAQRDYYIERPIKTLYIDNSGAFFNHIRMNKFYKWLSECPGVSHDLLIVRMN